MKKLLIIVVPILILAIFGGAFIGYSQSKKTPNNSLKTIRDTINSHDLAGFNKLVDVDTILDSAADGILLEKLQEDKTAYSVQQVAEVYNNQIKPDFINVTKEAIEEYVQSGKVTLPNPVQTEAQRWLKHSEMSSCVIESMSKPVITGDSAVAVVYFKNEALKFTFELELSLERLGKNEKGWKIVGIKGFEDFNKSLKRALAKKLDSLNAPIRAQMDDIISIKELNAKIGEGDEYGFSQTLKIAMKADVKSSKPLSKILGKIIVDDGEERDNFAPFTIDMAYHPQGLQTFNIDKVLNPFVRGDVNIMKHGMRRNQLSAEIDEIIFLDGTNIKAMDRLPD